MSMLTRTALVHFCMYLLALLVLAPFSTIGGQSFSEGFSTHFGDLVPMVVLPLLFALISELIHRIVTISRNSVLSIPVPWLQVIATVYLMNIVMGFLASDETWSVLVMLLVALASLAAFLFRGKLLPLLSFWLLNACAVSVIGVCWTGAFLINEGMPTFEEGLSGLGLIASCLMVGISSYANYIRIK